MINSKSNPTWKIAVCFELGCLCYKQLNAVFATKIHNMLIKFIFLTYIKLDSKFLYFSDKKN